MLRFLGLVEMDALIILVKGSDKLFPARKCGLNVSVLWHKVHSIRTPFEKGYSTWRKL